MGCFMNVIAAQNSGMYSPRSTQDGVQKAASDMQGSGRPQDAALASGRETNPSLKDTTVDPNAPAASTKVVESASEALGLLIDTRA